MTDLLNIAGKEYRIVANWNALVSFLKAVGRDTMEGLTDAANIAPSDIAPLMAACLNEGCRKDGKEERFTAEELGDICDYQTIGDFLSIYIDQIVPKSSVNAPEAKKK